MKVKGLFPVLVMIVVAVGVAIGQPAEVSPGAGTATGDILKLDVSARASALAGAYTGVSNEVSAIYWNPAGLGLLNQTQLGATYGMWLDETSYEWCGLAVPTRKGTFGGAVTLLQAGSVSETIRNLSSPYEPEYTGRDASASELVACLAYARTWKALSLGANLKLLQMKLGEYSGLGYGADVGLLFAPGILNRGLSLGLAVQNIGTGGTVGEGAETLPLNIKAGFGLHVLRNKVNHLLVSADVGKAIDSRLRASAGLEYRIFDLLSLRGGYKITGYDLGSFTAGTGFHIKNFDIDYAWAQYGDLNNTHRVTLTLRFGMEKQEIMEVDAGQLFSEAVEYYRDMKYDEAIACLKKLLKVDRAYPDAKSYLEKAQRMKKMPEKMRISTYKRECWTRVEGFWNRKDWALAAKELKRILKVDPNHAPSKKRLKKCQEYLK